MKDLHLTALLESDDGPIAAVLLSRGRWLTSSAFLEIAQYFPATEDSPALWAIGLYEDDPARPFHTVYVQAADIVAVSIRRNHATSE